MPETKYVVRTPRQRGICVLGKCSTAKTSSALIYTGSCLLLGIKGITDGTNALTLSVYDNTSAAGDIWDQTIIPGGDYHGGIIYPVPMDITTGIYVAASGGTFKFFVYYQELN